MPACPPSTLSGNWQSQGSGFPTASWPQRAKPTADAEFKRCNGWETYPKLATSKTNKWQLPSFKNWLIFSKATIQSCPCSSSSGSARISLASGSSARQISPNLNSQSWILSSMSKMISSPAHCPVGMELILTRDRLNKCRCSHYCWSCHEVIVTSGSISWLTHQNLIITLFGLPTGQGETQSMENRQ